MGLSPRDYSRTELNPHGIELVVDVAGVPPLVAVGNAPSLLRSTKYPWLPSSLQPLTGKNKAKSKDI